MLRRNEVLICIFFSEFYFSTNKRTLNGLSNDTRKLKEGDSCYSLRTKTKQKLLKIKLLSEHEKLIADIADIISDEMVPLICTYNKKRSCQNTTLCVSKVGCFCWKGWHGENCENCKNINNFASINVLKQNWKLGLACDEGTYGFNCNKQCGQCINQTTCDVQTGHCQGCMDESYAMPLCQSQSIGVLSHIFNCPLFMERLFIDKKETSGQQTAVWIVAGVSAILLLAAITAGIFFIFWKRQKTKPDNQMTLLNSKNCLFCRTNCSTKFVHLIYF